MRKNKKRKTVALFLVAVFLLAPFSLNDFWQGGVVFQKGSASIEDETYYEDEHIVWDKGEDILIENNLIIGDKSTLEIRPGAIIKFKKRKDKKAPQITVVDTGEIIAVGNETDKILFTSDYEDSAFSIVFNSNNNDFINASFFRYVEISKAGGEYEYTFEEPVLCFLEKVKKFISRASAEGFVTKKEKNYPILHRGGVLMMENCWFQGNKSVDLFVEESVFSIKNNEQNIFEENIISIVNSNFENNQENLAVVSKYECVFSDGNENQAKCDKALLLKNNFYGNTNGPEIIRAKYENKNQGGSPGIFGAKIIGENFKLDGFRKKDLVADPVLIVPGIMGSEKGMFGKELKLDPILHTYDNLVTSLEKNGYEKNKNLIEFPYDWRISSAVTAEELDKKIEKIQLDSTFVSSIDIVAHSMGGLVARHYLQNKDFVFNVDQFITLGTPHQGSPEAYLKWEAGEGFLSWREFLAKHHFTREARHKGYDDLFSYIQTEVLSVRELLPVYDYLYDVESQTMRSYHDNYPRNYFLENLNSENLEKLDLVRFVNIIGEIDDENTIEKIRVQNWDEDEKWKHGKPENYDDKNTDRGIETGKGDETVPTKSAKAKDFIPEEKTIQIDSTHSQLPTKAQCEIFSMLSGRKTCFFEDSIEIPNILLFNVFSPVDIQVIDPNGNKIGKDFQANQEISQIPDAYYSGFETPCQDNQEEMCQNQNEFITIPNPKQGKYQIITQGTKDGGEYEIQTTLISEDQANPDQPQESTLAFEGTAYEGVIQEKEIQITSNNELTEPEEIIPQDPITFKSIREDVEKYYQEGKIKSKKEKNYLQAKLQKLIVLENILSHFQSHPHHKFPIFKKAIKNLEKIIQKEIQSLIGRIEKMSPKVIDKNTKEDLVGKLEGAYIY